MPALRSSISEDPSRYRVLTGERPTGQLHLGHYVGTLRERIRLQDAGVETFVILADYQVITDRDTAGAVRENVCSAVLDHLAAGVDPTRSTIFTHSAIPELNQLFLPFLSLITEAELHRNPTVKSELLASGRALNGLPLTYPVHQAADILFCKGNVVPVGKDNLPHVEVTRTVACRFNERYGEVFPEPRALITEAPELPGLDRRKMSKSYGNTITLAMSEDQTAERIRKAPTDSERTITYDPDARPGVYALLETASACSGRTPQDIADDVGSKGSGALKVLTAEAVNELLRDLRHRRASLDPADATEVLRSGNHAARRIAVDTLEETRAAMGMRY